MQKKDAPPPGDAVTAEFEAFREYLGHAVAQLLQEMADQQVSYAVPAGDVTALLRAVAQVRGVSPWEVYLDWALRHILPAHRLMELAAEGPLTPVQWQALRKRLRDLLGYTVLGLVLAEHDGP